MFSPTQALTLFLIGLPGVHGGPRWRFPLIVNFLFSASNLLLVRFMFPGKINPRQMKKMMKQLGMEMEELAAREVVIKLEDREIVIENPSVSVVKAMGQKTYQITGEEREVTSIPEEDVKLVAEQAGVSLEEAREALEKTGGDLAEAIVLLTS